MSRPAVAVVGGGIAGLAAAWELLRDNDVDVTLLEASAQVGGKLRTAQVAGFGVDVGAESTLARRPEVTDLIVETGLGGLLVHPRPAPAQVWSRGRLEPLPPRTLMGVPSDPETALGLLTTPEVERLRAEPVGVPLESDVAVGDFVEERLGAAVVDRLVEPLLAGVYAGHSRRLSTQACIPALWAAANSGGSLLAAAAQAAGPPASAAAAETGTPVFAGYAGGLGRFATDLADRLFAAGVTIRTGATVRALERIATGWRLVIGPTIAAEPLDVDAVVLAAPGAPAARLLGSVAPVAASLLAGVEYASVALVTLALPRVAAPLLTGSGFLVPPVEPLTVKAATFSSAKWSWVDDLDPGIVLVRASLGRAGETAVLQREDAELVRLVLADLRAVLGHDLPEPVDALVQRWGGALPQYAVGHVARVAAVHADVAAQPGLAVAGAAYEGVGIAASVASGRRAAQQVAAHLRARRPAGADDREWTHEPQAVAEPGA